MGNYCGNSIKVLTNAGEIIDVKGPKLARQIVNNFPGYVVCRKGEASMFPLNGDEWLVCDGFYHLVPVETVGNDGGIAGGVSSSAGFLENLSGMQVLSRKKNGVWKVKLVIDSHQLEDILSEQVNTGALIEKMRTAAASSATVTPKRSKGSRVVVVGCKPNIVKAAP
ncbi:putative Electron transporter [Hibiscus syriacus]|uniref:Electron transporter n=1 Tax=Hibiscus syriacus TaxID=106335 RepID=A0A6A2ZG59_HIBSY|nr:putative Electron transporter [Hibiscus syriacus]